MATIPLQSPVPPPTPRRIRFAPLPDPRRAVLVTDDGTELPLPSLLIDGNSFDLFNSNLESPSSAASQLASIPAAISLSALNSPVHTPLHTPQSWNAPLPETAPSPAPSPAHFEKTFSSESDSSNSSNNSSFYTGSTSGSPPTSGISSSASSMYSLTPTQSIDPYPVSSTGSSTPTQPMRKSNSLRSKLSSKYNISTDQILSLGTINLFRSRSKGKDKAGDSDGDSIHSAHGGSGWGGALTRWTSGGSGGPDGAGVPLYRTQSTQSYKGGNVRNKRSSSPASIRTKSRSNSNSSKLNPAHESGMISTLHSGGPTKKGTRMLNGRVYGAKRGSASGSPVNPFANAKDDPDPEFVEWGYGGMGSVKNVQEGVGGRVWGRVLSSGTGAHEGANKQNAAERTVQTDDAAGGEDDGSGMGWVRKRREMREREAKEQAEKERLEKEAQEKANENDEPDVSDARSFSSTTTSGTSKTVTSNAIAGTVRNIPTPLPLPDVGELDASAIDSPGGSAVGSPTPTLGSNMLTPTASALGTPKPRAIEAVLSSPGSGSGDSNSLSPDPRGMSRQASNTSAASGVSSPGKEEEHVLTAINIPAPPPMSKHHSNHSHHHSHSRGKSLLDAVLKVESNQGKADSSTEEKIGGEQSLSKAAVGEEVVENHTVSDIQKGSDGEDRISLTGRRKPRQESISSTSSSSSSVSSRSGSESDPESEKNHNESDDEDEEDEDEETEEKIRKTSLGAGVEKISRHK